MRPRCGGSAMPTDRKEADLERLVTRFGGHKPAEQSTGFDYQFLANRQSGSEKCRAEHRARVTGPPRVRIFISIHLTSFILFSAGGSLSRSVSINLSHDPFTLVTLPAGMVHRQGNEGREPEEHLAIICPEPAPGQPLDYQIGMPPGIAGPAVPK